jgi:hypothetical protein
MVGYRQAAQVMKEVPCRQRNGRMAWPFNQMSHLQNNLFAQTLRYAQNFIIGISCICLRQNFSHALILNENLSFAKGSDSCL